MENKTIVPSQTFTSGFQSGAFGFSGNQVAQGCHLYLNISAVSGVTPILTMQIQEQDPLSGNWGNIPGAVTASLATPGLNIMTLYPGVAALANVMVSANMPNTMRAAFSISGTNPSFTLSLSGQALA